MLPMVTDTDGCAYVYPDGMVNVALFLTVLIPLCARTEASSGFTVASCGTLKAKDRLHWLPQLSCKGRLFRLV